MPNYCGKPDNQPYVRYIGIDCVTKIFSVLPWKAARRLIESSGALAPNATIVKPTTSAETPKALASAAVPRTSRSPLHSRKARRSTTKFYQCKTVNEEQKNQEYPLVSNLAIFFLP